MDVIYYITMKVGRKAIKRKKKKKKKSEKKKKYVRFHSQMFLAN